jgi:hypothetical protein
MPRYAVTVEFDVKPGGYLTPEIARQNIVVEVYACLGDSVNPTVSQPRLVESSEVEQ